MIKGKTNSGFEFEVHDVIANDYELVEQLSELDTNPAVLPKILNKVLGKEQSDKLKDHVRNEEGIVPFNKMMDEIAEIFSNGNTELKNS